MLSKTAISGSAPDGPTRKYSTLVIVIAGALTCLPLLWHFRATPIYKKNVNTAQPQAPELARPTIDTDYWYNNITIDANKNEHMRHTEYTLSSCRSRPSDFRYIYPPPDRPFLQVEGFKFCRCLNRATFFADLVLDLPSGPARLSRDKAAEFTSLLDYTARKLLERENAKWYQREILVTAEYRDDFAARGQCFALVQGYSNDFPSLLNSDNPHRKNQGRLVRTIDAHVAFRFLNFDGVIKSPYFSGQEKKRYKLAYIIMIHDKPENVAALIDALLSPDNSVFIYLHIDHGRDYWATESYRQEISKIASSRKNVAVMETRFAITWGHISMLWAELRAFFDLLDIISFDYLINLSGSDYPLKNASVIYNHLQRRPGGNWMYWNDGGGQLNWRLEKMFHCTDQSSVNCFWDSTDRESRSWKSLEDVFRHKYKGSQWMILHADAVQYLRHSERMKILLTWAEHTHCPDEMILPIFFAASPFVNQTYKDPKRLMRWDGGQHPFTWTMKEKWDIEYWQKYFCWIRKVDVVKDKEMKKLLDGIREKGKMWDGAVAEFKWGVVPVDK